MLSKLRRRIAGWLVLRTLVAALAAMGGTALLFILADAALDLPEGIRATAWAAVGLAVLVVVAFGVRAGRRLTEGFVARLFERNNPALGNRLINAVQLAAAPAKTPIEEAFRRKAVALGAESAARLKAWPVVRSGLRAVCVALGGVAAAVALLALVEGELLRAVLPRFLDPHGDHPPFSRLKIEVTPQQAEVLYGGQLEVRATTSGRPVDKLWLIARSGTNVTRTMMFLAPDKSYFQTLANLREQTEFYVTDGSARSRRFPITIRYTPQITLVEVTTTFPEYTGRAAKTAKLTDEVQALPQGTRIRFRVASNRPLKSGTLSLTPVLGGRTEEVALEPEAQPNIVSGEFTLNEPTAFQLSIRDVGGLGCAEPQRGRFNILPDEKPRLFVLEPGRDAVATPSIHIPVKVEASDDYGVTRVLWLRGHNRSIERPFRMPLKLESSPTRVEAVAVLELDQLGVRPGDVIDYYFEAADNYPAGPNVTISRPFRLEIISEEQYAAILRQAAARKALFEPYFRLDAWLKRLAERSRSLAAQDPSDAATREEAEALAAELAKYEQELGKLLQSPIMFDVEQAFRTSLVAQHTGIQRAQSRLRQALKSGSLDDRLLKEVGEQLTELARREDEEIHQPAQQIASVVQVLARADAFVKLARQQAVLAQLLRRFPEKTEPLSRMEQMEVQELAHQQRRIGEALRLWLEQLPELVAKVPADPEYDRLRNDVAVFIKAVEEAGIESDLEGAAGALDTPDTLMGYALALSAAEKMDRLIARCEAMSDVGEQALEARFRPTLSKPGVGSTLQQILTAVGVGSGDGGRDGYGLFNENVGLYGPGMQLAGEQAGGRGGAGRAGGRGAAQISGDALDDGIRPPDATARVRLQRDAKFPLRYREIVGEYFRAIAESQEGVP
ncbi:MAG TPA: hypothetical protein GYA07_05485 [Verrucomicrobia bacterium]|nr:hypothetical protein [Verrucomicrobiota bacterium]HOB32328.1 hypothetical protein [Verrucomicrobiota bacterium]HOP96918.1 hypothetical protein [Verrucomicrobiota bacterium]